MNKPLRLLKKLLAYNVLLLLVWPALLYLSGVATQMVWTLHYTAFSYMMQHYARFLSSAAKMTLFLWLAFFVKRALLELQKLLEKKKRERAAVADGAPQAEKPRHPFQGKEFAIVYCVLDVAAVGVWIYLAASFIMLTINSASPITYARLFARDGVFPYSVNNLLAVAGAALVSGGLAFALRRQRDSLQTILQSVFLFSAVMLLTMGLVMLFNLDITTAAEWLLLLVSLYLVASLAYGIILQIKNIGNMNFARLRPLLALGAQDEPAPQAQAAPPAPVAPPAQTAPPADQAAQAPSEERGTRAAGAAGAPSLQTGAPAHSNAPLAMAGDVPLAVQHTPRRAPAQAKPPRPKKAKRSLRERTGLSFKSLWTVRFTLRMLPYLVLFIALVLFLSTTMYTIEPSQQALVYRFGTLQAASITDPGLHFKLPYPIDIVEIHDVSRMRSLYVGYAPSATSNDYLWTSTHGGEEYTLLSGDGNELIAVNMRLNYYIDDLMRYRTCYNDPETLLNDYAYVIMMEKTMNSNLDTVLSVDRVALANEVRAGLNAFSDEQRLGLEVANVIIENIHPPVEVAEVYQNVINASIQKTTLTTAADAYALETLSAAEQQSTSAIAAATKAQITSVAEATREAEVFVAACEAYVLSPDSYTLYKLTDAYQQLIAGTRLYVFSPGAQGDMDRFLLTNGQAVTLVE